MNELKCIKCGETLVETINGKYKCTGCDSIFYFGLKELRCEKCGGTLEETAKEKYVCSDCKYVFYEDYKSEGNEQCYTKDVISAKVKVELFNEWEEAYRLLDIEGRELLGLKNKFKSECITKIKIPDFITEIGESAFFDCHNLKNIVIPDGVKRIDNCAFAKCNALKSVLIPNSVISIGDRAFYQCCTLTSVDIPDRVTSVGACAFENCVNLLSVVIPKSVTSIGYKAFSGDHHCIVYCEREKPKNGYPDGWDKECFDDVSQVVWNYKKE